MQTTAVSHSAVIRAAALPPGDLVVGDWLVEPDLDRVSRDGVSVHVRPKLMDLLVYLAQNAGRTVPHDELRASVWPGQPFIAGTVLPRCIAELRQALGDHAADSMLIQTIPKRGYRLIAAVRPAADVMSESNARAGRPSLHRSGVRPGERVQARLSLPSVPRSPAGPMPLPATHGARVAEWLRRARLGAARLWRSFRSRVE